jgi:protoporphyrinogen oxidase
VLCKELGLGERLHGTNPHKKNTYVLNRNRLLPLPDGLAMMIPTNIEAILKSRLVSWFSKARMGLDFLLPAKRVNGDESLGGFVSRRLGREAYENLIEPLMSGIYAGDGDQLSLASTFPYLRDLELKYGSLARGALKMRQQSNGKAVQGSRSAFLTPTTGLAELVEKLIEHLTIKGAELRLNTSALRVTNTRSRYRVELKSGEALDADSVILATPAFVSGSLLSSLDSRLAYNLQKIPYASTATVSLAYRESGVPRDLDGYGYVIPRRKDACALAPGLRQSFRIVPRQMRSHPRLYWKRGQDIPGMKMICLRWQRGTKPYVQVTVRTAVAACLPYGTEPCRSTTSVILRSSNASMPRWRNILGWHWPATAIAALASRIASIPASWP